MTLLLLLHDHDHDHDRDPRRRLFVISNNVNVFLPRLGPTSDNTRFCPDVSEYINPLLHFYLLNYFLN